MTRSEDGFVLHPEHDAAARAALLAYASATNDLHLRDELREWVREIRRDLRGAQHARLDSLRLLGEGRAAAKNTGSTRRARAVRAALDDQIVKEVRALRAAEYTWEEIGGALGVSRAAAWARYSKLAGQSTAATPNDDTND